MESLVSTEWLAGEIGKPDLRILDASWFLPDAGRDGRTEYESAHIPGASFVDLESLSDPDSELPHMLPSAALFAARMRSLGVGDHDRIVIYDNSPLHTAARVWWMLRLFGARQVAILDGGLALWLAEGRPVESGTRETRPGHFTPGRGEDEVADKAHVLGLGEETMLVDARPAARFRGDNPEPRPGLAAGHIPGSKSLPQSELFEPDGRWKRGAALRAAFADAGIDLSKPMVTTCGSGVTAAVLLFGAHLLGKEDVRLYDGSWTEWGSDPATPKATGPE
jgi:thiosulfate/3-mercaptopyruvate sulfurtransferase